MARAVPEGEPKLTRPHLANDELEHGGARRLREPVHLNGLTQRRQRQRGLPQRRHSLWRLPVGGKPAKVIGA